MYEIFEHTADVGIRARAGDLNQLFVDAARGLLSVMVANPEAIQPAEEVTVELSGDDVETLLHDWLAELLYAFSGRRLALAEFDVRIEMETHPTKLRATARGEPIDLARHQIDVEVKAITWHGLKVEQNNGQWTAEVIVDI